MRIKTNAPALNTTNILNRNTSALSKTLEKLSSGYRINRSGDDAAGLAISEGMRALIAGMEQAERNVQDGIGFIATAEGALSEVHAMLNRLKTLSVQSANGTYKDSPDRGNLQEELKAICDEIDRIAENTSFAGVRMFQNKGPQAELSLSPAISMGGQTFSPAGGRFSPEEANVSSPAPSLSDVLSDNDGALKNIIYTETTFDFTTTQAPTGTSNNFTDQKYITAANTLQTSIVPQVVSAIMNQYTAFNYLTGSSIGIGLNLYSDNSSSVLASVTLRTEYYTNQAGAIVDPTLTYRLSVNMAKVGDLSDPAARSSLEQTIAHEMIHAFMDEATTTGMTGLSPDGNVQKFPSWFIEGMAQTASGPGNWTRGASLNLNKNSSEAEISTALKRSGTILGSGTSASEYGTGYLACMYLGYMAGGTNVNMANPEAAAKSITEGLSNILLKLITGKSLTTVINDTTGGKYADIQSFEKGFASDTQALGFIQHLLQYTSDSPHNDGNVGGGLISGSLAETDPVADGVMSGLNLFALNPQNTDVKNIYPSGVTVLSGGGSTVSGKKPVDTIPDPAPPVPIVYPDDVFAVTGGAKGIDWDWDKDTGTLTILTDKVSGISGGTLEKDGRLYRGTIVIYDNVFTGTSSPLNLSNIAIDASQKPGTAAGIQIGKGNDISLNFTGIDNTVVGGSAGIAIGDGSHLTLRSSGVSKNTITGTGESAGIQLAGNNISGKSIADQQKENDALAGSSVDIIIDSDSTLTANGGSGSRGGAGIGAAWATDTSKGHITVSGSGTLHANGGYGAAGIGGSEGGSIGEIDIHGIDGAPHTLTVKAVGGEHGAGIGGGWASSTMTYREKPKVESITIYGPADIDASSKHHGTGIGGGCRGFAGAITIGKPGDTGKLTVKASGGDEGAGIGAGWDGRMTSVTINGGTILANAGTKGAGIGSGYQAQGGDIVINGGDITAKGSTNSSGIGSGMNGTVGTITITGGTGNGGTRITADGGWTYDGGNIGGYTDFAGSSKATVHIEDPFGVSIKAGEVGEGKYITTGTVGGADKAPLYALRLSYLDELIKNKTIPLTPGSAGGAAPDSLSYPLREVKLESSDGTAGSWMNLQHGTEHNAYIWAKGQDMKLTFTDANGNTGSVELKFFPDHGLWRFDEAELPKELPKEPGYVDTSTTGPGQSAEGGIILQVGAHSTDTFSIPRFYFCRAALRLGEFDVSTQPNASDTIGKVEAAINRVSEIRGVYGAKHNALEHISNSLNINRENLADAESRIRDTNMPEELTRHTKNNILIQATQSMLAQANAIPRYVLQLLQ